MNIFASQFFSNYLPIFFQRFPPILLQVLISFTQYRETSPVRCGGEEIQTEATNTPRKVQEIQAGAIKSPRKNSSEMQQREKTWLAQKEIESFEEK